MILKTYSGIESLIPGGMRVPLASTTLVRCPISLQPFHSRRFSTELEGFENNMLKYLILLLFALLKAAKLVIRFGIRYFPNRILRILISEILFAILSKMSKGELIDEHVSLRQLELAVESLLTHEAKKEQTRQETELLPGKEQNVWLNITVKKIPSGHKFKPAKM